MRAGRLMGGRRRMWERALSLLEELPDERERALRIEPCEVHLAAGEAARAVRADGCDRRSVSDQRRASGVAWADAALSAAEVRREPRELVAVGVRRVDELGAGARALEREDREAA